MITTVTYARLFNLGNYENERLEVTATVENGDVSAAFLECHTAVVAEQAQLVAEREAAEKRRREEWEAEQAEKRAKRDAERIARTQATGNEDLEF
jgi:hypothetical protein